MRGLLYVDDAGTRLCDALMESYPPQCGWAWVVVANPGDLDVELDEAQGIAWSPSPVVLTGTYDGTRFVLDDGPEPSPTAADEAMVAAFVAFAGGGAVDDVPLAATVSLGLADEIVRSVPATDLGSPAAWVIERMEFRGWSGPFSAVDLADTDVGITVGPHAHCASPPVAAPPGFEDHRRVSIQPTDATSCLEWFTVDFFVDDDEIFVDKRFPAGSTAVGLRETITYGGIETLRLDADTGIDLVTVAVTHVGDSFFNGGKGNDWIAIRATQGSGTTVVNGGDGDDQIFASSRAGLDLDEAEPAAVYGDGESLPRFPNTNSELASDKGLLEDIDAALEVNGGDGIDRFLADDRADTDDAEGGVLTSTTLTGLGMGATITYDAT